LDGAAAQRRAGAAALRRFLAEAAEMLLWMEEILHQLIGWFIP